MPIPQIQTVSAFSLLKSTVRLPDYLQQAKAAGFTHVALTDENQLSGVLEFCRLAQTLALTPMIGVTLDFHYENSTYKLLIYALNLTGYQNLLQLSTVTMMNGPQTLDVITKIHDGLLFVLPDANPVRQLVDENQKEQANLFLDEFQPLIASRQFLIGVDPLTTFNEVGKLRFNNWLRFVKGRALPCVAAHQVNYLAENDYFAIAVLQAISTGAVLEPTKTPATGPNYLVSPFLIEQQLRELGHEEIIKNSLHFAEKFGFTPPLKQKLLPHYPLAAGTDAKTFLRKLAEAKLVLRIDNPTDVYRKRLNYELSVIESMGFADYFLIVWDVMNYCHTHNVMTGAGRGSSASSLVAYVLEITDVDPIKYDLLFERFLNPDRKTMPDIDLDIPDNKREEVLSYVAQKYGATQVAQIATFGTLAAKMVLRDVSRVLGLSQSEANQWSGAIPNVLKISLKDSLAQSAPLQKLVHASERNELLFKTALQLEGLPRHVSTHAAGVVIGDGPLVQWVPLQQGSNSIALTQFTMGDVEAIGLLKMDFLGLKNLAILQDAVDLTEKITKQPFNVAKIPLDDEKTIALFARGDTAGIFQFESNGIRSVLRRLGPTSFEDIVAVNALYRPGPMDNIESFIKRKKGQEKITYPDESVKEILANTYGIIIYQEQVMQVANRLAGFSMGQADILRRAVSKKKKALIDEQRGIFVAGVVNQNHPQHVGEQVYDYIEKFANYGFPRSHAFAYSVVGFQLAYLKSHYPKAFFTAILNSVSNQDTKLKGYLGEAKKAQLKILGPDINLSGSRFTMTEDGIRFGLSKIKGLRRDFLHEIFTQRQDGPYKSLDDFIFRIDTKWRKDELLVPLILAGAFDAMNPNRRQLITQVDGKIKNIVYSGGSANLLATLELKDEEIDDYTAAERLDYEEAYLGTFVSGHPLEVTTPFEKSYGTTYIADYQVGKVVKSFVYVKEVKKIRTKKGEQMAFLTAQDLTGEISLTLFPLLFRQVFLKIKEQELYYITGKVETSRYQDELQVLVESIAPFTEVEHAPVLFLRVTKEGNALKSIANLLKKNPGLSPVRLYYSEEKQVRQLGAEFNVNPSEKVLATLYKILQKENVVLQIS